ncbi:hypothetical protein HYX18_04875 [Candidatus Woesearchaeota archaeon]|nr:hypothetical protein [Candidatus Woesearchaeota archaeon]
MVQSFTVRNLEKTIEFFEQTYLNLLISTARGLSREKTYQEIVPLFPEKRKYYSTHLRVLERVCDDSPDTSLSNALKEKTTSIKLALDDKKLYFLESDDIVKILELLKGYHKHYLGHLRR